MGPMSWSLKASTTKYTSLDNLQQQSNIDVLLTILEAETSKGQGTNTCSAWQKLVLCGC